MLATKINSQRYALTGNDKETLDQLSRVLAGNLAEYNPLFDGVKFLQACGVSEV